MFWPVTTVDDFAENILAQQISQIPGIAQVSIGGQQKPAVRVQIDPTPSWPRWVCKWRMWRASSQPRPWMRPRVRSTDRSARLTIYEQRSAAQGRAVERRGGGYKNGAPIRIRDIGVAVGRPGNRPVEGLAKWPRRHSAAAGLQAAGPTSSDAAQRVETLLPRATQSVPASIKVDIVANRTTTIKGLGRGRRTHARADDRTGGDGDLPVPAQRLGDDQPGVTVPLSLLGPPP